MLHDNAKSIYSHLWKIFWRPDGHRSVGGVLWMKMQRIFSGAVMPIIIVIVISCAGQSEKTGVPPENMINFSIAKSLNGKWVSADNFPDGCSENDSVGLRIISVRGDSVATWQRFRFKNSVIERELRYRIVSVEDGLVAVQNKWGMSMRYRINSNDSMTMIDKDSNELELKRCE